MHDYSFKWNLKYNQCGFKFNINSQVLQTQTQFIVKVTEILIQFIFSVKNEKSSSFDHITLLCDQNEKKKKKNTLSVASKLSYTSSLVICTASHDRTFTVFLSCRKTIFHTKFPLSNSPDLFYTKVTFTKCPLCTREKWMRAM